MLKTEPRVVTAIACFRAGPGREQEAAEAWAFELKYYFRRGIAEPPKVDFHHGIYQVTGKMTTTYPTDTDPTVFDAGTTWDLDFCGDSGRRQRLRELYDLDGDRWDGTDDGRMTLSLEHAVRSLADDPVPFVRDQGREQDP